MTEKQWTEGPWKLRPEFSEDHGQYSIEGADGIELTRVEAWMGKHREESRANARLIAAAPELFEALQGISDVLMGRPDIVAALRPLMGPAEHAAFNRAAAALSRAREV